MPRRFRRARTARALVAAVPLMVAGLAPAPAHARAAPITVISSTVTPSTIIGGGGGTQTITLSRAVGSAGLSLSLYGDATYRVSTGGGTLYLKPGQTSVTFPFRIGAPSTTRTFTLSAQTPGTMVKGIASFTLKAADPATRAVSELTFGSDAAVTGSSLTGTVRLKYPAPEGGLTVSLWGGGAYSAGISVPTYVLVPEGRTSATFPARVSTPHASSQPEILTSSADLGTSRALRDVVIVSKIFALSSGAPRRNSVDKMAIGLGDVPNPSGAVVTLHSDDPAVKVPAQVTVPAGQPGVAFEYTMGDFAFGTPWPKVTATWNGNTYTTTLYPS
ncbi:hypothetical protein [Thermomonospora umbrina]|uniref:Ig-like domain-containing protein n=1 Tax=Thermomonospora umbrina TaxID=111806 RepID=A0A3D9SUV3_9ACTN|nr:hypothetical protein [Thermomonospora umbrina]REE96344.1 hypothetical protein DFJ69_1774 [Thermomonospora umbrina]